MTLIYLYSIIYGVRLFTLTVRYSVGQFVFQIVKVMNIGLIKFIPHSLWSLSIHCYSLFFSWPVRYLNRESNEYGTNIFIQHFLWSLSIHYYSLLFSLPVLYLNRKSNEYCTNIFILHY